VTLDPVKTSCPVGPGSKSVRVRLLRYEYHVLCIFELVIFQVVDAFFHLLLGSTIDFCS
jgi:hypothetical protein